MPESGDDETKRRGRPKGPTGAAKPVRVSVRATVGWRDWLEALAEFDRSTVADVIDRALVDYARAKGFDRLPPRR